MDIFKPAKRSNIMSRIRSKNTKAELIVFRFLNQEHLYYQKHYKRIIGRPDIALPRKKKAIFIDGDFWHGRTFEDLVKRRGSLDDHWVIKIAKNMERDKKTRKLLLSEGWSLLVIWEEDILRKRTRDETLDRIKLFLTS